MRRRDWLKLSLATGFGASALGVLAREVHQLWRQRHPAITSDFRRKIRAEIEEHLANYALDPSALEHFARDAEQYRAFLADESSRRIDLPSRFLLSTDFFEHGADPRRSARYVRFFHPWVTPCRPPGDEE